MTPSIRLAAVALAATAIFPPAHAVVLFQAGGADAASIQTTVDNFRSALGALNTSVGPFSAGRREINWDGAPDTAADPVFTPGDQFNGATGGRARGILFATSGSGFKQGADASNPTATPANFGFNEFNPFSAARIFSPFGSSVMTADFFVPGSVTTVASVSGFGAVFLGVELDTAAFIDAYDAQGSLIGSVSAPVGAFSFAAIHFNAGQSIGRVVITSGTQAIDTLAQQGVDFVAMDDFIYGEPIAAVPEPGTYALMVAGLAAVAGVARRRKR